ncbi:MAG: hypothetical protein L0Z50_37235, partial [Verrucomicrobiales bacterium]|nr:hypothetical protein [Verrucomicrobiales bacterium]
AAPMLFQKSIVVAIVSASFRAGIRTMVPLKKGAVSDWVVATRPLANNGLALSLENTKRKVEKAESFFRLALDTPAIYREWLRLVETYGVSGVNAHDARIVAAMKVHAISHLLTFNVEDFRRYQKAEIVVVTPAEILRSVST